MRELDKVIGYESIKNELYRIIDIFHNSEKYKALGVTLPRGVMFEGEPGIGKTLMAKSFIKESGRKKYVIRKDRSNGEFVDYIRETFEKAAEHEPSIVLLDDLDKFANEDYNHRDAEEYVAVQACIDEFKDEDIFVVATCNDIDSLPRSLIREGRFDKIFSMHFPVNEDAKKIIAFYLKDKAIADDIDIDEIARFSEGKSCATLETVVNLAGVLAGYENKKSISQEDLRRACFSTYWDICEDRICPEESLRRKAVHEAGHAAMIECFFPGEVSLISVSAESRRSDALVVRKHDGYRGESFSKTEIEIMINLAGKAASELVLGEIDMGTDRDLRAAYDHMDDLLNYISAYDFKLHRNDRSETSNDVMNHLDTAKGVELSRYYFKTKQILMQNRAFLEALIEQVIEKKTVTYKEIAPIREKYLSEIKSAA